MTSMEKKASLLFSEYASEQVTAENIKGTIYGFWSELSCLRIFAKYNSNGTVYNKKVRVGYSENLKTWFVSLETNLK